MMIKSQMLAGSWRRWWSSNAPSVGPVWLQLAWTFAVSMTVAPVSTLTGYLVFGGEDARCDETSRLFARIKGYEGGLPVSRADVPWFKAM